MSKDCCIVVDCCCCFGRGGGSVMDATLLVVRVLAVDWKVIASALREEERKREEKQ